MPAVQLFHDDGQSETVMESEAIARRLEALVPTPAMHLDDPRTVAAGDALREFVQPLRPLLVPLCADRILRAAGDERGADWFVATREARMKRPLAEFAERMGGEGAWARLEAGGAAVVACIAGDGPFFLGEQGAPALLPVVLRRVLTPAQ